MSDAPTTPPSSAEEFVILHTAADALLSRYGDTWAISRETLTVFIAVQRNGTATRVLAGEPAALLAAIAKAEAEEAGQQRED